MHNIRWSIGIVTLLAFQTLVWGDTPSLLLHPEEYRQVCEVQGRVQEVDAEAGWLTVQDSSGRAWHIHIDRDTAITNSDNKNVSFSRLQKRDTVNIFYTTWDMNARQVDVLSSRYAPLLPS